MKYDRRLVDPVEVCLIVAFEDATRDRFLMVRHRTRGWELPGGRVEARETASEAAVREFQEETGRSLLDLRFVLRRSDRGHTTQVFTGSVGPALPGARPDDASVEVRFVRHLDDVAPLAFPDDDYTSVAQALGRPLWSGRASDMS